ncbi:MAG: QueT transporter family protein [Eubacteriales bacterium]|nr:QueT transporter family protein [Eubacteriales bacterium]
MKTTKVQFMTQAAMIAAIYVVLCLVFEPISYGAIQTRIAEALTVLPYFTPAAIPGLFVGCLIANLLGGGIMLDVICGSLATLIGAVGTYALRRRSKYLASIPPIAANIVIVPWVLKLGYGEPLPIPFLMGTVGVGEILTAGIIGTFLLCVLSRYRNVLFGKGSYTAQ